MEILIVLCVLGQTMDAGSASSVHSHAVFALAKARGRLFTGSRNGEIGVFDRWSEAQRESRASSSRGDNHSTDIPGVFGWSMILLRLLLLALLPLSPSYSVAGLVKGRCLCHIRLADSVCLLCSDGRSPERDGRRSSGEQLVSCMVHGENVLASRIQCSK